jgi:hypothetical protein
MKLKAKETSTKWPNKNIKILKIRTEMKKKNI